MKLILGQPYLKTPEVKTLTGLTTGQVNAARTRGDLVPHQMVDGGDCYFLPSDILYLQKQIFTTGFCGTAKLRKVPIIKDWDKYHTVVNRLSRYGYECSDFRTLDVAQEGAGYVPVFGSTTSEAAVGVHEALETPVVPASPPAPFVPPVADRLPFAFELGSDTFLGEEGVTNEDFENVKGCFGYADETNTECSKNCAFYLLCAQTRFDVLRNIAAGLEMGAGPETILEAEKAVIQQGIQNVSALLF